MKNVRGMGSRGATSGRESAGRDLGLEAYNKLKEALEEGAITPGTRVTETELSERFDMSRTPIREAISRLESEGLLQRHSAQVRKRRQADPDLAFQADGHV